MAETAGRGTPASARASVAADELGDTRAIKARLLSVLDGTATPTQAALKPPSCCERT